MFDGGRSFMWSHLQQNENNEANNKICCLKKWWICSTHATQAAAWSSNWTTLKHNSHWPIGPLVLKCFKADSKRERVVKCWDLSFPQTDGGSLNQLLNTLSLHATCSPVPLTRNMGNLASEWGNFLTQTHVCVKCWERMTACLCIFWRSCYSLPNCDALLIGDMRCRT